MEDYNTNRFTVEGNRIFYKENVLLTAKGLIIDYLEIEGGIIVLIDGSQSKDNQNVYFYDFDGKIKWQIPLSDVLHFDNYYTSIYMLDGQLHAYNINGVEVTLNKENGSIVKKALIK